eukprot:scaffold298_cov247-Pinguiococcus_pyrenoidosus.AAC.27
MFFLASTTDGRVSPNCAACTRGTQGRLVGAAISTAQPRKRTQQRTTEASSEVQEPVSFARGARGGRYPQSASVVTTSPGPLEEDPARASTPFATLTCASMRERSCALNSMRVSGSRNSPVLMMYCTRVLMSYQMAVPFGRTNLNFFLPKRVNMMGGRLSSAARERPRFPPAILKSATVVSPESPSDARPDGPSGKPHLFWSTSAVAASRFRPRPLRGGNSGAASASLLVRYCARRSR